MIGSRTTLRRAPWRWITAIWLGVGLIDASQTVFPMRAQGMHHNWVRLFVVLVLDWLPWALATPLVMSLGRRYRLAGTAKVKTVSMHLCVVLLISLTTAMWSALLEVALDPWAQTQPAGTYVGLVAARLSYGLLTSMIVYGFILAIASSMESAGRIAKRDAQTAQLSERLAQAQLDALRQQMDPHFMFNTLNAVSGLVRDHKNDAAVSMIVGLSELLRRSALDTGRPQVTLREEVDYLQRFLEIQKARFGERLQLVLDIPSDLFGLLVPNLILQPLVENAVKHGIAKRIEGGRIEIVGRRLGNTLSLRVFNDVTGTPLDQGVTPSGIGLSNLRTRLTILYGSHFSMMLNSPTTGGFEITISLPIGAHT